MKRYEAMADPNVDSTHARVIRLVGRDKRVLELGCATGYMSRVLTDASGCVVTAVEINPDAAEQARASCARVIVGDLDTLNWDDALGTEQFDVVVAADVLEHLRNPAGILAAVRAHLVPGGYLVASVPNVAHTSVLAELLQGRFTYQPFGLLDDTHIRFFTRDSLFECLEEGGFTVTQLDRLILGPAETEFRTELASFPPAVVEWLASREEATTYQFILMACPLPSPASSDDTPEWPRHSGSADASARRSVLDLLAGQHPADAIEGILQANAARIAYLENTRAHQTETIAVLRQTVAKHEEYIRAITSESERRHQESERRHQESERRHQELSKAETYTTGLLAELADVRAELNRAADYTRDLERALAASQQRLVQERTRIADAAERERNAISRELQEENSRLLAEWAEERARLFAEWAVERARAAGELELLKQTVARLTSALETYQRSRSWKLTAPLRGAARLLRGQRYRR